MSASPQLEDGFLRIANELIEAILGFGFTHHEVLILLTIIRKTYGYGKKTDDISASQIGDMCKIARQHVTTTLNGLALKNVIVKSSGRFGSVIGIQKNHKKWVGKEQLKTVFASPESGHPCPENGHVQKPDSSSPKSGQVDSPESGHTKENLPKENQQKKAISDSQANRAPEIGPDDIRRCPTGTLVDLYHELMPFNPQVKVLNESRKSAIRARWLEASKLQCAPFGYSTRPDGLAAWRQFFEVCAESKFLTGKAPAQPGKPAFVADIDFIFSPSGFAKTLENKYHRDAQ